MKKLLLILSISIGFNSLSQNQPYVEFETPNEFDLKKGIVIEAYGTIRLLNDNTDPCNIKTYIQNLRKYDPTNPNGAFTPPQVPNGWSTIVLQSEVRTEYNWDLGNEFKSVNDENGTNYIRWH